jgi:hypothetical protein
MKIPPQNTSQQTRESNTTQSPMISVLHRGESVLLNETDDPSCKAFNDYMRAKLEIKNKSQTNDNNHQTTTTLETDSSKLDTSSCISRFCICINNLCKRIFNRQ